MKSDHTTSWYLSNHKMTVLVIVNDDDVVTDAAPVVRKFIGQPLANLLRWMKPDISQRLHGTTDSVDSVS